MILLAAIGAIGFLIVTWFAVSNLRARRAERREEREARERDWATGQAVYKGVLDDYSAYLLDPFAWLQRPSSKTSTSRRRPRSSKHSPTPRRSTSTSSRRPKPNRPVPHRGPRTPAAWDKADENARRIGTSIYERSSRNKLRKAAYALRTASTLPPPRPSAKPPPRPSRS
ncbi:hypothetical protein GS426_13115 [Rhodococcus hoagii]|nr:hypothetical protein [Prescottella equi]